METTTNQPIAKKLANALILDAKGREKVIHEAGLVATVQNFALTGIPFGYSSTQKTLRDLPKIYGGLWVGGSLSLYKDSLQFEPNAMNAALQTGSLNVNIPLSTIVSSSVRFGVLTKIIDVVWEQDGIQYLNSFRCFGAEEFSKKIETAVQAAKSGASA